MDGNDKLILEGVTPQPMDTATKKAAALIVGSGVVAASLLVAGLVWLALKIIPALVFFFGAMAAAT